MSVNPRRLQTNYHLLSLTRFSGAHGIHEEVQFIPSQWNPRPEICLRSNLLSFARECRPDAWTSALICQFIIRQPRDSGCVLIKFAPSDDEGHVGFDAEKCRSSYLSRQASTGEAERKIHSVETGGIEQTLSNTKKASIDSLSWPSSGVSIRMAHLVLSEISH